MKLSKIKNAPDKELNELLRNGETGATKYLILKEMQAREVAKLNETKFDYLKAGDEVINLDSDAGHRELREVAKVTPKMIFLKPKGISDHNKFNKKTGDEIGCASDSFPTRLQRFTDDQLQNFKNKAGKAGISYLR